MRQHFVNDSMSSDGCKCRGTLRTKHYQVGLLRIALVEEFFGRIAGHDDSLDGYLLPHIRRHQHEKVVLDFIECPAC